MGIRPRAAVALPVDESDRLLAEMGNAARLREAAAIEARLLMDPDGNVIGASSGIDVSEDTPVKSQITQD